MSLGIYEKILDLCKRLHSKNMLAAADGNISYRFHDERIVITPSGKAKAFMAEDDLARITLSGRVLEGHPSGESSMHLEVYRRCPKAKAVVHAHPPTAIAWTLARPDLEELEGECLPEVILAAGKIPIASYARPCTEEMARAIRPFLPTRKLMILARHGALSWGESLEEAYRGMERLEHCAQILKAAHELGGAKKLPALEIEALMAMREKMGHKTL
ncbi:MAG: class II aldolase/adducin family protein [Bacteriovoracales bacterium]|nr:class II aldolase/adducin family protein [Bacteriovoracales bacterium]